MWTAATVHPLPLQTWNRSLQRRLEKSHLELHEEQFRFPPPHTHADTHKHSAGVSSLLLGRKPLLLIIQSRSSDLSTTLTLLSGLFVAVWSVSHRQTSGHVSTVYLTLQLSFSVHLQFLKSGASGFMGFLFVRRETVNADRCLIGCALKCWSDLMGGWFFPLDISWTRHRNEGCSPIWKRSITAGLSGAVLAAFLSKENSPAEKQLSLESLQDQPIRTLGTFISLCSITVVQLVDLPSPRCVLAKPLLLASNLGPDAVLLFLLVNSDCFAVPCIHQACTYVCRQQARALGFTAAIIKFRN